MERVSKGKNIQLFKRFDLLKIKYIRKIYLKIYQAFFLFEGKVEFGWITFKMNNIFLVISWKMRGKGWVEKLAMYLELT